MRDDPFSVQIPGAPAVFGAEPLEPADVQEDSVVYLHTAEKAEPGADVTFQLYRSDGGELLLPAFTALDGLVNVFGESQAWIGVPNHRVAPIQRASTATHIIWNPAPAPDQPPATPSQ